MIPASNEARGAQLWKLLRSPRLALVILGFLAIYCGIACWLPWVSSKTVSPPPWAGYVGLDRPFSSAPFLVACVILFLNTFACTWERGRRVHSVWRGDFQGRPLSPALPVAESERFLLAHGFHRNGGVFYRHRFALWGGFVLHLGILLLLIAVTVQRSTFDGGAFQLVEGQLVNLRDPGAVFDRDKGWFAPAEPPNIEVGLTSFNAFLHQSGYAPDRSSGLHLAIPGGAAREAVIDRAHGIALGAVTIYQAIPSGLALNLSNDTLGMRSLHLRTESETVSVADVTDPAGNPARFTVTSEHGPDNMRGTGQVSIVYEQGGRRTALQQGTPFSFGGQQTTIAAVTRWGGFTYARSPGVGLVFAGFGFILAGCLLLVFPAGVARVGEDGTSLYLSRGYDALQIDWNDAAMGGEAEPT